MSVADDHTGGDVCSELGADAAAPATWSSPAKRIDLSATLTEPRDRLSQGCVSTLHRALPLGREARGCRNQLDLINFNHYD